MTRFGRASRLSVLRRLQRGIEELYRVRTDLDVDDFMIDEAERAEAAVARSPREQLLVAQHEGEEDLRLGLFLDRDAVANLERHDPARGLGDHNFGDFCLAVEGVSHFVYVALAAAAERGVSALELELQAEVDKFVCCLLVEEAHVLGPEATRTLRRRLFEDVDYHADLDADERGRYRTANDEARRYASALERRFLADRRLHLMLDDLRRFYRKDLQAKLHHIAGLAA